MIQTVLSDLASVALQLGMLQGTVGIGAQNSAEISREINRLAPHVKVIENLNAGDVDQVEVLIAWSVEGSLLAAMPALRLIQANGAGVDGILKQLIGRENIPVCRTIDHSLADGMASYVAWAVLDHLRDMAHYRVSQLHQQWAPRKISLPATHRVGVAGAGEMGQACLEVLSQIGFPTSAWSRTMRTNLRLGVKKFAGDDSLDDFLRECDTLVCLLPLTQQTRGFLSKRVFDALPAGSHVINVGRGEHLIEADLVDALSSGQLARATLDVAPNEPLANGHPLWSCPGVVLTPHVAARASAESVAIQTLINLKALREGRELSNKINVAAGY